MSEQLPNIGSMALKAICLRAMHLAPKELSTMLQAFREYAGTDKEDAAVTMFNAFVVKFQLGVPMPFAELWDNCKTRKILMTSVTPPAIPQT